MGAAEGGGGGGNTFNIRDPNQYAFEISSSLIPDQMIWN